MEVTNKTVGVIFYAGNSYGPGQVLKLVEGDESKGDIAGMIGDGRLAVKLGDKPSEGLTVEEIKAALTVKKVAIPEGAKKSELAALLDAS